MSAAAALARPERALALELEVPVRMQVSLLDRVIPFDRNFAARVHDKLVVAVVVDEKNVDSERVGAQLLAELGARELLGSYKHTATRVAFSSASGLSEDCKRLRAGVVYVTPGVRERAAALAGALQGSKVMSVASLPEHVGEGIVLGSAVRSGKPRVLVNLKQARRQAIDFRADFLRMVEVVG
jgi:hypothetical protein